MARTMLYLILLCFGMAACTHAGKNQRAVASTTLGENRYLTQHQLKELGPLGFLKLLENECCKPIMVESIEGAWITKSEATELGQSTHSSNPAAPVVSNNSSITCRGKKYISTVGREARHLLLAFTKGRYPQAICSTYDLLLPDEN